MSLSSFASGLFDMASGLAPSEAYDFPFPLNFNAALQARVPSYRNRQDLFPKITADKNTLAVAEVITERISQYSADVEKLFQLDKDSDVAKINRDALDNQDVPISATYLNVSAGFCTDMMELWQDGWTAIEGLGVGRLFDKKPEEGIVSKIGTLAYDMAVILILLHAYGEMVNAPTNAEHVVACLVVARRCLPNSTAMIDTLFQLYQRSTKPLAKFDLEAAVKTLELTVGVDPEEAEEKGKELEVQRKEAVDVFRAPVDAAHRNTFPYIILAVGPEGVPVGYVPIGPPLFGAGGHLQAFTNRMVDLFPLVVGTVLPPAAPTLAEVAGPGVLRELGKRA